MDLNKFNKYEYFDYYDHAELEKLNEKRSKQWIRLYKKIKGAKEKGDEKAFTKAKEAMKKHEDEDSFIKAKAEETGFYWC
jgi:urate oxidase